jgi:hypothetical protein
LAVEPDVRVNTISSLYSQSVFSIVNVGRGRPESRYDLHAVFLRPVTRGLVIVSRGVRSGNDYTPVEECDGLRVVEAGNRSISHDAHARVDWLGWVVEDCIIVWVTPKTETSDPVLTAIHDHVGPVGETSH